MRQTPRRIRSRLEAGECAFGVTVQLPSPESVEIAGYVGYDFAWIDAEHGTMGIGDLNHLVRTADAVGIDAIVRVPDHNPSFIQRVLDLGAAGIMAPHVRSVEDARAIVRAAKFAPAGIRGACPAVRMVGHVSENWREDYVKANDDVLVFGLIEDREGVDEVEAIAVESGLDGLLCGPFDLSMGMGLHGDVAHPDVAGLQTRVAHAARDAGIEYVAIAGWEARDLATMTEDGVRIFNVSGDRGGLYMQFKQALEGIRTSLADVRPVEAAS